MIQIVSLRLEYILKWHAKIHFCYDNRLHFTNALSEIVYNITINCPGNNSLLCYISEKTLRYFRVALCSKSVPAHTLWIHCKKRISLQILLNPVPLSRVKLVQHRTPSKSQSNIARHPEVGIQTIWFQTAFSRIYTVMLSDRNGSKIDTFHEPTTFKQNVQKSFDHITTFAGHEYG